METFTMSRKEAPRPAAGPWPGLTVAPSRDIRRAILDTVMVTRDVPNPDTETARK